MDLVEPPAWMFYACVNQLYYLRHCSPSTFCSEAKRQRDAMTAINTEKDSLKDFKQIFRTKMSRSNDPAVRSKFI